MTSWSVCDGLGTVLADGVADGVELGWRAAADRAMLLGRSGNAEVLVLTVDHATARLYPGWTAGCVDDASLRAVLDDLVDAAVGDAPTGPRR